MRVIKILFNKRHLKTAASGLLMTVLLSVGSLVTLGTPAAHATAGINKSLNYQG